MAAVKLGPYLRELRIHLCQTSKSSEGVRNFIQQQYVSLKKSNPQFPILIRECSSIKPIIHARYDYGKEEHVSLENLKSDEVLTCIKKLASNKPA